MSYDFNVLNQMIQKTSFNGVVLISNDQNQLFKKGYGYKDIEQKLPIDSTTPMRIASITKTITAVAILKLMEDGFLDLSDSIQKYVSFCKHDITIHHLLSNSSGIPNFPLTYDFSEALKNKNPLKAIIETFIDHELNFEPGTKWEYSVAGYLVLQYIIEEVTKKEYYGYLKEVIFDSIHMKNTYFEYPDLKIDRAKQYTYKDSLQEVDFFDMRIAGAGGALLSSADDIDTFNKALLKGEIISNNSVDLLFTKHILIAENTYYGYGMIIDRHDEYKVMRRRFYHSGGGFGVRTFNTFYPDDSLQVVLLSNSDEKDSFNEVRTMIDKFLLM